MFVAHHLIPGVADECPLQMLLSQLPGLPVDARGKLDLLGKSPPRLLSVAESAEAAVASVNIGLSAVGVLLAWPRPATEERQNGPDSMQAHPWFVAGLAAVVWAWQNLSLQCRRANGGSE
jgi:hypothetical protein